MGSQGLQTSLAKSYYIGTHLCVGIHIFIGFSLIENQLIFLQLQYLIALNFPMRSAFHSREYFIFSTRSHSHASSLICVLTKGYD